MVIDALGVCAVTIQKCLTLYWVMCKPAVCWRNDFCLYYSCLYKKQRSHLNISFISVWRHWLSSILCLLINPQCSSHHSWSVFGEFSFYCSWSLASQCDLCELPLLTWKLFSTIFLAAFVCDLPHWMPIFWPQKMLLKLYRYIAFLLLLGHPYKSVPLTVILLYLCFLASSYIFSHFPFLSKAAT